jgi:outer membrane protein assembly factor BamE
MRPVLIALLALALGACGFVGFPGVYRINIEQGNIVTQEMVDQLKPGMSRRQVRFILGTPLIEDTFNQDRWDYIYVLRNGRDVLDEQRLTVFFDGDELTHYDDSSAGRRPGEGSEEPEAG